MMHGAVIIQIRGNFDDGMRLVQEIGETTPVEIVNSINPFRIQGQKTIAFEVIEALTDAPDYHVLPVGNAGNITAHWIGYSESAGFSTQAYTVPAAERHYQHQKIATRRPVMVGYQAAGAAPIVGGKAIANPETVATAIRIGNPMSWKQAVCASQEANGWFDVCSDEEILSAQKLLASKEGVFCEPASAISIAGLLNDLRRGRIRSGATVVCTLTGHGLKDPDTAIAQSVKPITVDAQRAQIEAVIQGHLR
jgi:threonine synthase